MLTSGELAKQCQISLRTVQFYDQKGIVKASCIGDGNKRLYDEDAVACMQQVCLYRMLGFSLDEIKQLLHQEDVKGLYAQLKEKERSLRIQQKAIDEQSSFLESMLNVVARYETITSFDKLSIITQKRKAYRKQQMLQYIFLFGLIMIEIVLFMVAQDYTFLLLVACFTVLLLLVLLIRFHARHNAYICPVCHTYFELTLLQDACTLNNGRKGKRLTCPTCGRKGNFKEQYRK